MLNRSMYSAQDWKKEVVAGFSNRKFLAEVWNQYTHVHKERMRFELRPVQQNFTDK